MRAQTNAQTPMKIRAWVFHMTTKKQIIHMKNL